MKLHFIKMHGVGNDYVYFDGFAQELPPPESIAQRISDRHFGVGGDGIIYMLPCEEGDASMRMFNADGSEGNMCGNAIRCVGKYIVERGYAKGDVLRIQTKSGIKSLELIRQGGAITGATVDMGSAILKPQEIPARFEGESVVSKPLKVGTTEYLVTCVSMGNPHCVTFVDEPEMIDLPLVGPLIEHDVHFPQRVNAEFVTVESPTHLRMRVWERGSGETLACGTGACASTVAAVLNGHCAQGEEITISLRGGELMIRYAQDGTVFMTGPAVAVFEGMIEV